MHQPPRPAPRILISYRDADTKSDALLLHIRLSARFGESRVFLDEDKSSESEQSVRDSRPDSDQKIVLLVVIGRKWMTARDETTDKWARQIAAALSDSHTAVIPVVVGAAHMPISDDLPLDLRPILERTHVELRPASWNEDAENLIQTVEEKLRISKEATSVVRVVPVQPPHDWLGATVSMPASTDRGSTIRVPSSESVDATVIRRPDGAIRVDDNVQFTVFRPAAIEPAKWYDLLAFAHLADKPADAPPDELDPVAEVQRQAQQIIGGADFKQTTQDSRYAVMREGELRFVPRMEGIEFNPPERRFLWNETVHKEQFRLRARPDMDGQTARGVLTVFAGNVLLADVVLSIKVDRAHAQVVRQERAETRPYRRIFASYSHKDVGVVEEFESHATATGDRYLRDVLALRSGEVWSDNLLKMINEADVFQLFWSWNAISSPFVQAEWQHALALNRPHFIRPVFWEEPLPEQPGLPPESLRCLHFQRVYPNTARTSPKPKTGAVVVQTRLSPAFPVPLEAQANPSATSTVLKRASRVPSARTLLRFAAVGVPVLAAAVFVAVLYRGSNQSVGSGNPDSTTADARPSEDGSLPVPGGSSHPDSGAPGAAAPGSSASDFPVAGAPAPQEAGDEEGVRDALRRYASAYESLSVADVLKVCPGVPADKLAEYFSNFSSLKMTPQIQDLSVSGSSATVSTMVRYEYRTKPSKEPNSDPRGTAFVDNRAETYVLEKGVDGWIILEIR